MVSLHNALKIFSTVKTIMFDKVIDDLEKEKAIQKSAIQMLKLSLIIIFKFALILAVTLMPVIIGEVFEITTSLEVVEFALRLDVLIATTVILILTVWAFKKRKDS